jgi:hypothetical protein
MLSTEEVEILQRAWAPLAHPQRILVVGHHHALLRGQTRPPVFRHLMRLATVASLDPLVSVLRTGAGIV